MADAFPTTLLRRGTTSVPPFPCTEIPRLPPHTEAAAERAVPGIRVVAETIERMLATDRLCTGSRFWVAALARHAAVLVAARRCPGRLPTPADLARIGLDEAAAVTNEAWMASAAKRLGLPG